MLKKIFILVNAVLLFAGVNDLYAEKSDRPFIIKGPDGSIRGIGRVTHDDLTGRMRTLAEDIEDLEDKMRRMAKDTHRYVKAAQEREMLALEFIHEAQIFLLEHPDGELDKRRIKIITTMKNLVRMLGYSLKNIPAFPFPDRLEDAEGLVRDIIAGKVQWKGKSARRELMLLKNIQEEQKRVLSEYHKRQLSN